MALLFSKNFLPKSRVVEEVMQGGLMVIRAKYELFTHVFINVYAPNTGPDRVQFLNELSVVLSLCGSEEFLFRKGF